MHDLTELLQLPDGFTNAVLAHMLLCIALSAKKAHAPVAEIRRVLRPSGTFVCTSGYSTGIAHGHDIHEHGASLSTLPTSPRRRIGHLLEPHAYATPALPALHQPLISAHDSQGRCPAGAPLPTTGGAANATQYCLCTTDSGVRLRPLRPRGHCSPPAPAAEPERLIARTSRTTDQAHHRAPNDESVFTLQIRGICTMTGYFT
ncbi:hypothetical protein ACIBM4_05790 [Streptomyces sp. NPDC050256]|uniref:hypothetical protein n=1 Tax=Streptomyces sp. NPDC050256 TaxID=3365607 RepID=UPI003797B190